MKTYKEQIFEEVMKENNRLNRPLSRAEVCKVYDNVRSKNHYNRTTHSYTTSNGNLTEGLNNGKVKGWLLTGAYGLTKVARNQYIATIYDDYPTL